MAEIRIDGLDALKRALDELPKRTANKHLRAAVASGARVIRDAAKTKAPVYTGPVSQGHPPPGTLKRSIVAKFIKEKSTNTKQVYYVTARRGKQYQKQGKKGNLSQDAFYAHMVEFGTVKMSPRPFLRPAFDTKKDDAVRAITKTIQTRVIEEAAALRGGK